MHLKSWIVKKAGGEDWGCIKKLLIDSRTRQLSYADVALNQNNQIVRVPWSELEVRQEGIFLKAMDLPPVSATNCSSPFSSLDILEVPTHVAGKIGQSRRSLSPHNSSSTKMHP
jgi:hypothetical protein